MNYNRAESIFSTTVLSDQLYSNMQNIHISSFKSGAIIKISGGIFVRFTTARMEPVGAAAARWRQNFFESIVEILRF